MFLRPVGFLFLVLLLSQCSENFSDNPKANQPPRTFISIFTENVLNPSTSRQVLSWWGDDPDGVVEGFIYTFNESAPSLTTWSSGAQDADWTFTTKTQETFSLTLLGNDTTYTFWVKAVDDQGAVDPDGAVQQYPITNSQPTVAFLEGQDVPDTTYTVATFSWSSSDLDGDDTIAKFQYTLGDTADPSAWIDLAPTVRSRTLTANDGLTEGEHVFYLRALDVASSSSPIIRMPRDESDVWYVREPRSTFLLLDDYNFADGTDSFYKNTFEALVGPVEVWDIRSNGGALEPPSTIAFTQTLLLFNRIFWYTDPAPTFEKAQAGIPDFLEGGGKIIMSIRFTEFANPENTPLDFSPVDSLVGKINRIRRGQTVQPSPAFAAMGFPEMTSTPSILANIFPLVPKISARSFYILPENPGQWTGTPTVAVIDAASSFVFFELPLAQFDGMGTVSQFLEKILNEIF